MEKILYIIRGIPGAGKSTFAKTLTGIHFESDMFFIIEGEYKFDISQIKKSHDWCIESVEHELSRSTHNVIVSNTFTQEWEMKPYFDMAKKYEYTVFCVVIENRHGGINVHNAPDEVIEKMRNRFDISL